MPTLPNMITSSRFVMGPVLLWLAFQGRATAFLIVFAFVLLTDSVDGVIARRLGQLTDFGARLDSWADLVTYMTLPVCAWRLWPDVMRREMPFVIAVLASYLAPVLLGLCKYRRLPSHHTWGAKTSAVLMAGSLVLLFAGITPWPFRLATPITMLTALEDMLITAVLPRWQANVPTIREALALRREAFSASRTLEQEHSCHVTATEQPLQKGPLS